MTISNLGLIMVGDLNLKKSWNPKLLKNQEKVWKKEQHALGEHQKIQQRIEEICKEREKSERLKLQYPNQSDRTCQSEMRIEWMYDKQNSKVNEDLPGGTNDVVESRTMGQRKEFLLGKRRKCKKVEKSQNTIRQVSTKLRGDIAVQDEVAIIEETVGKAIDQRADTLLECQRVTRERNNTDNSDIDT